MPRTRRGTHFNNSIVRPKRSKRALVGALITLSLVSFGAYRVFQPGKPRLSQILHLSPTLTKDSLGVSLRHSLESTSNESFLPVHVDLPIRNKSTPVILQYSIDSRLQVDMEALFHTYRPDYGAFVALDPETGRILSLISYSHASPGIGNLALKGNLPSASVFKVVTAAAAMAGGKLSPESLIAVNGQYHTLYRRNVLNPHNNRWTRYISLREAFAKSVNTAFGRIGAFFVGPQEMTKYALAFGFNRAIASDLPFEQGRASITDDAWKLAEAASGYTQENTMSPLQGALIASAIANDGKMMEPYMVQSVYTEKGENLYTVQPELVTVSVDSATALKVRELMSETVQHGTARGTFRPFFKHNPLASSLEIGGKTGSLTGRDPRGKYDWFIGYARSKSGKKIAFAALTIHKEFWRVKSAYLARRAIESYFSAPAIYVSAINNNF